MKRIGSTVAFLFCAFLGGAFAQSLGGGISQSFASTWLNIVAAFSGSYGASDVNINYLNVNGDSSTTTGINSAFAVNHSIGTSFIGYSTAMRGVINITGSQASNASRDHVVGSFFGTASADGNSDNLYGMNPQVILASGATNWGGVIGGEIDFSANTGSTVTDKVGLRVLLGTNDTVAGTRMNNGITIGGPGASSPGLDCGFCVGGYSSYNPVDATGTLFGSFGHAGAVGSGSMGTVGYGIDISQFTFASAPFVAPLMTPSSSSASCKQGSTEWDASYIYVCTATNTWKRATLAGF